MAMNNPAMKTQQKRPSVRI